MILYDELISISVYDLIKTGALGTHTETEWKISCQQPAEDIDKISILINTKHSQPFLVVSSISGGVNKNYKINLVPKPFNLNTGNLWYFICPVTGIQCRKLFYYQGYFLHRKAINGIYRKQALASNIRNIINRFENVMALGKMTKKVNAPYFRPTYASAPTKTYKQIIAKLQGQV